MKKRLIILFLIAALFGGAFSFLYPRINSSEKLVSGRADMGNELSQKEEERLIKENTAKYQPKITNKTKVNGLNVAAKSAIVVDQNTNEIIFSKNINEKMHPASIIKVLTFITAMEVYKENDLIEISEFSSQQIANKISMKPGEKLKLSDLLYGLMMISANDAAYAIADYYKDGFDGFVGLANKKTNLLGLKDTTMKNPAGLDHKEQLSTVFDMATITRYALINHPSIIKYAGKKTEHSVYATENNEPHWWFGHLSRMLTAYPHMIAAKTGFTYEAGTTYIGIAEKNGRRLVLVMMGSDSASANNDVKKLLDFGFAN